MHKQFVIAAGALGLLSGATPGAAQTTTGSFQEVLTYLEPYRSIEISPVESGVIQEVHVKEGERVTKGQKLISLDSDVIQARLEIAQFQAKVEGRLLAAKAEVELQQDRLDKLAPLVRSGTSNSAELARQAAALKQAQGNLLMAQEEIKTAEIQARQIEAELHRRAVISPIDGTVAEISKDVAEPVTAPLNQQESFLIRIVQLDRLKCVGHVPAHLVSTLGMESILDVKVPDRMGEKTVKGRIEFISPVIDPATATVRIRLILDNASGELHSGATAHILVPMPDGAAAKTR